MINGLQIQQNIAGNTSKRQLCTGNKDSPTVCLLNRAWHQSKLNYFDTFINRCSWRFGLCVERVPVMCSFIKYQSLFWAFATDTRYRISNNLWLYIFMTCKHSRILAIKFARFTSKLAVIPCRNQMCISLQALLYMLLYRSIRVLRSQRNYSYCIQNLPKRY